jgi:hypothetical protein
LRREKQQVQGKNKRFFRVFDKISLFCFERIIKTGADAADGYCTTGGARVAGAQSTM